MSVDTKWCVHAQQRYSINPHYIVVTDSTVLYVAQQQQMLNLSQTPFGRAVYFSDFF